MRRKHRIHGRFHARRGAVRRWLAVLLVLTVAGMGWGYYYLTRPQRLAKITTQLLEQMTGAQVRIDSADFNWGGTIELRGVKLFVPGLPPQQAQLFDADQALLKIDPWALLRGKFTARQINLIRPSLWLTEIGQDKFNFSVLQNLRTGDTELPALPRIYIQQGSLRFGEVHDGRYQAIGVMQLGGSLNPDPDRPERYIYELYQYKANDPSATASAPLTGKFDLKNLSVDANLADFQFADPHRNMLPRQVRQWWDRFEPSGSLQDVRIDYDPRTGPSADVKVQGVAITLPMLTTKDYRARMTDVSGAFHFDANQVRIDNLVGEIEGLQYIINGTIDGYGPNAAFNITLKTLPFRIPEKPRYMVALPLPVQKAFGLLTPIGWLRVSMKMSRAAPTGEIPGAIDYQGSAQILSGADLRAELRGTKLAENLTDEDVNSHGHYEKFPYELNNCRGLITFDTKLIEVKNLTGDTGGGGSVTITGTITPQGITPAVDLVVTAVNIPFDQKLHDALGETQQKSLDAFFNRPQWDRLHKAGFYVTTAEHDADEKRHTELQAAIRDDKEKSLPTDSHQAEFDKVATSLKLPIFDLGGHANVVVKVTRDETATSEHPFNLHTTIDFTDANVVFMFFPYPVRVQQGRLILMRDSVSFENFVAVGLHTGHGGISGTVDYVGEDRHIDPHIALQAIGLPLDELLFESLGEFRGRWLRQLRMAGAVNVETSIFRKNDQIDFIAAVDLQDNTATPGGGGFTLTDLRGKFTATLNTIKLENVTGHRGEGRVRIDGDSEWTNAEKPTAKISVAATGLHFEDHVLDLIDAFNHDAAVAVTKTWDQYQPAGIFDTDAAYTLASDGQKNFDLKLRPKNLDLTYANLRMKLTGVTGSVAVADGVATFDHFAAELDGGQISLNGTAKFGDEPETDLAVTASGDRFSPSFHALMPASINNLIAALKLTGKYEMDFPRFKVRPAAKEGRWLDTQGTMKLTGGTLQVGLGITDFNGDVALTAVADAGAERPAITADIHADHLRVTDRLIEDFRMQLRPGAVTPGGPADSRMLIPLLAGKCAGGLIAGTGALDIADSRFVLQMALSDADLAILAKAEPAPGSVSAAPHVTPSPTPPTAAQPAAPLPGPSALPDPLPAVTQLPAAIQGAVLPAAKQDKPISGRVSASLTLEGSWADASQLRGRGDMVVREGQLYGVPMAFGLFRITHLALPVTDTFESASLGYYVREDRVIFERIRMDSKSMRLAGTGSMQLSTGDVDLTLTTSNPGGLDLGPLTDLMAKFRNQLLTIRVTGTLQQPVTKAQQFTGFTRAWQDVFGPK